MHSGDKQKLFAQAFFTRKDQQGRPCDVFAAIGGNRAGKSFAAGVLCLARWLRDYATDGAWIWCVAQTLDRSIGGQQQELWKALPRGRFGKQTWEPKGGFGSGHHAKLELPTDDGGKCLVEFRSADQDLSTFEQAKLDGAWVDERCPESVYSRLIPRIIDKNGFILYSDIPEQWWQVERLEQADPGAGVYYQQFDMHDNEHNLPVGSIDKAAARMTKEEQDQKIRGKFGLMEGLVYREYIDQMKHEGGHLVRPFVIPDEWPKGRLIDYGGSAPTACAWVAIGPDEDIYVYREYYERGPSVAKHAAGILSSSGAEAYQWELIDPCAFNDHPGMSDSIAIQYTKAGFKTLRGWPRVNEMGEHAMVQKVKARWENRKLWVFEGLVNLRRELKSWKYKTDKDGKVLPTDKFDATGPCHLLDDLKGFIAINPCFAHSKAIVHNG